MTRNVTKDHVLEIFGNFGNITYCDLPVDKGKTWLHLEKCYVEFEKLEEAEECVKKMDGGNNFWNFKIKSLFLRARGNRGCKKGEVIDQKVCILDFHAFSSKDSENNEKTRQNAESKQTFDLTRKIEILEKYSSKR